MGAQDPDCPFWTEELSLGPPSQVHRAEHSPWRGEAPCPPAPTSLPRRAEGRENAPRSLRPLCSECRWLPGKGPGLSRTNLGLPLACLCPSLTWNKSRRCPLLPSLLAEAPVAPAGGRERQARRVARHVARRVAQHRHKAGGPVFLCPAGPSSPLEQSPGAGLAQRLPRVSGRRARVWVPPSEPGPLSRGLLPPQCLRGRAACDAAQPFLALTSWEGDRRRRGEMLP